MYQVPESLIRTTTIKVKVTKAEAKPTETPAVTEPAASTEIPTSQPAATVSPQPGDVSAAPGATVSPQPGKASAAPEAPASSQPGDVSAAPETPASSQPGNVSEAPVAAGKPSATKKPAAKKTTLKVKLHKNGSKITVQSLPKAKITTVVYKNKKTAQKGKKAGRIRKYAVVKTNKKGKLTIRLKKKMKKKQAVRITAVKKPYRQKTVVKVKK